MEWLQTAILMKKFFENGRLEEKLLFALNTETIPDYERCEAEIFELEDKEERDAEFYSPIQ